MLLMIKVLALRSDAFNFELLTLIKLEHHLAYFKIHVFYYSACILLNKKLVSSNYFTISTYFTIHFLLYPRYIVP